MARCSREHGSSSTEREPDGPRLGSARAYNHLESGKENALRTKSNFFRRTLPRYVSKTSNICRPVEHPERTIRLFPPLILRPVAA